jgi:hypothetical protein
MMRSILIFFIVNADPLPGQTGATPMVLGR